MICCGEIFDDMLYVIDLAADDIKLLQNIDINSCPFCKNLDVKLSTAKYNIDNQLVTKKDMTEENQKNLVALKMQLNIY